MADKDKKITATEARAGKRSAEPDRRLPPSAPEGDKPGREDADRVGRQGKPPREAVRAVPEAGGAGGSRRRRFSEQYMPYLWGALGLFVIACLLIDCLCEAKTPDEHYMGYIGFGVSHALFGLFGWAGFMLPVVNFMMAISWRRYCREHLVGWQMSMSFVFILLVSAFIHVCLCAADPAVADMTDIGLLFRKGIFFKTGGVIGGWLGWLMYHGLKLAGSIVMMIITMPLLVMFLVGVTPAFVFALLKEKWLAARARRKERRAEEKARAAERAEWQAAHIAEMEDARRKAAEADAASAGKASPEAPSAGAGEKEPRRRTRRDGDRAEAEARAVWMDPYTGEILGEGGRPAQADGKADNTDNTVKSEDGTPADAKPGRGKTARGTAAVAVVDADPEDDPAIEDYDVQDGDTFLADAADGGERVTPQSADADFGLDGTASAASASDGTGSDAPDDDLTIVVDGGDGASDTDDPLADIPTLNGARGRGGMVVRVIKSDTAALKGTPENPTDGLPDDPEDSLTADGKPLSEVKAAAAGTTAATAAAADGDGNEGISAYEYPPIDLLARGSATYEADHAEITKNTRILRDTLESFHIRVKEIECSCGPTVTRFEVKPDTGVRVRAIANLVDDIALNLAKSGVRIEAPIPGKSAVGIEVPNDKPATVYLRNLLEAPEFVNHKSKLAACLGAEVSGRPIIFDIDKMPHLLVSGTTGSGKSVCINCIILSILYKATPSEVQLILVDPKKVEFNMYRSIPHLKTPIVTNPKKAAGALYAAVEEMEWRFELIEQVGVRNISGYNELTAGDPEHPPMPQLVIIIDELADLMMTAPTDVENAICRLAQKGRAAGIHLILGTQRPSVDVITGLIKANVPSRIAFTVKSQVDSRTIIDIAGAEKLIGRGDMLYAPVGATKPLRVQGAFVSDAEVESVTDYVKDHNPPPVFSEEFTDQIEMEAARCGSGKRKGEDSFSDGDFDALSAGGGSDVDPKFWEAVEVAVSAEKVSTSLLQRRAGLGYGRAAKIIDAMEQMGFVGPADGNKPRKLLLTPQEFAEMKMNGFKR